jgi:peptidoglycan-associated lipoprotein
MRFNRSLIPLAVILALGVGVACKKPAPAPAETAQPAPAPAPAPAAVQTTNDDNGASRKSEADAEAARKAAAAEMARLAKYKADAEAALKDINFEFDKSDIRDVDKPKLQAIADFLNAYGDAKILIAGNCDERGTIEYNMALGERRAYAARDYLKSLGASESRLDTISYGKERPKVQGHDDESWLINRNCEFTLK